MVKDSLTVCVISYNSEKTIVDTLQSVWQQRYKEIKIVVSDDCSSDDTVALVKKWIEDNNVKNITLNVNENNLGVSKNINKAYSFVETEWVKFVGADDILYPDYIEKCLDFASQNKLSVISTQCKTFGNNERVLPKRGKSVFFNLCSSEQFKYLGIGNFVIAPSLMFRSKVYESVSGGDDRFTLLEDLPLLLKLTSRNFKIGYIEEPLVGYRIHNNSISLSKNRVSLFKKELLNVYKFYFSTYGVLYKWHFFILSLSHGINRPVLKIIVKYISPLMWKMKIKEIVK